MKRKIIRINKEICTGCGLCAAGCPEGALQIIDGKACLVSDLLCDGLGGCIGTCPENAIVIEEREAELYDECKVLRNIVPQGNNVIRAHLQHLREHGQAEYLRQALEFLRAQKISVDISSDITGFPSAGQPCQGSQTLIFPPRQEEGTDRMGRSRLSHWPIQLHLVSPLALHYQGSDLVLAANCVAYALADFHNDYLKGRTLAIACPKLDSNQEKYREKIAAFIDQARVNSITVLVMQVPCCRGLLRLVIETADRSARPVSIRYVIVGLQGEILQEMPLKAAPLAVPRENT